MIYKREFLGAIIKTEVNTNKGKTMILTKMNLSLSALLILALSGCSQNVAQDTKSASVELFVSGTGSGLTKTENLSQNSLSSSSALDQATSGFQADLCFKRLRLKKWEDTTDDDTQDDNGHDDGPNHNSGDDSNTRLSHASASESDDSNDISPSSNGGEDGIDDSIDFNIGSITLNSETKSLGNVVIPVGRYRRVEFSLEPKCARQLSLVLSNAQGEFSSDKSIKLKVNGDFTIAEDTQLVIGLDTLKSALAKYDGSSDIKEIFKTNEGTCKKSDDSN